MVMVTGFNFIHDPSKWLSHKYYWICIRFLFLFLLQHYFSKAFYKSTFINIQSGCFQCFQVLCCLYCPELLQRYMNLSWINKIHKILNISWISVASLSVSCFNSLRSQGLVCFALDLNIERKCLSATSL